MLSYIEKNIKEKNEHAVLFWHAFPLSADMWEKQIDAVTAAGYPAIATNVYGVKGSQKKENWTFNHYVADVAQLLGKLHIEQVTLVGISMGGYQAFAMHKKFPGLLRSVVLCDTRAEADTDGARKNRFDFIDALAQNGSQEAVSRMIPNFFAKSTYRDKQALVDWTSKLIFSHEPEAIADQLRALASRDDSTDHLPKMNCPVTIIVGDKDKLAPPEIAKSMQSQIPNAKLEILADSGHLPNLEHPDVFNQVLLNHLAALDG
ncbi:alpha/beta hydrolase fold [Chloroherpeton thalassium ATCC 35110]|uniref:Alpha/beta hydrolase fold n=1 Tax=Chloroherpeton thalassium (strain ATCC 35110 / GB-78) TaxID=517418 RepID=B3QV40_CHLT3|nr:alpha/beta hydrolase [Chloroherpeton thalassium]ACF12994.1 alpha/beta hydrolase fold [Chloroherpeton thalassium ATCC 35110]